MPSQGIKDIARFMSTQLERHDWRFTLGGENLLRSDMVDDNFVLPLLLWRADALHQTAFGSETGVKMVADEAAFFGAKPDVESLRVSSSVLLLFCNEALKEVASLSHRFGKGSQPGEATEAQIDSMVSQWVESVNAGRVPGMTENDLSLAPVNALIERQDLSASV